MEIGGYCGPQYSSCAGSGGGGYGGTPFDSGSYFMGGYADLPGNIAGALAAFDQRVQNSRDALAANSAYQRGDIDTVRALFAQNPTLVFVFQPVLNLPANATPAQITRAYLDAFHITEYIDMTTLRIDDKGNATFQWTNQNEAETHLSGEQLFLFGSLGYLHRNEVGEPYLDFRSIRSDYSSRSLQVVSGSRRVHADTDQFNPYQGGELFAHFFGELVWHRLQRIFH